MYMENVENGIGKLEKPLENGGKTGKPHRRDRPARCLTCTNEWTARNGNEEKPSRCPVCGSRLVKWRDECTDEELGKTGKPLENMENQFSGMENGGGKVELPLEKLGNGIGKLENPLENVEKMENSPDPKPAIKTSDIPCVENTGKDGMEKVTLEEIQKNFTGIPVFPLIWIMGIIGVFGLIWFLVGQAKKRREARRRTVAESQTPTNPTDERIRLRLAGGVI